MEPVVDLPRIMASFGQLQDDISHFELTVDFDSEALKDLGSTMNSLGRHE